MIRLNYFCVVEGQQEAMYLKRISSLLRNPPQRTVSFQTKIGNASELKKSTVEYDKVCLFDHDFRKEEFENNLKICLALNNKRKKSDAAVEHAYSSICFDLWLVLHKKFVGRSATSAKEYVDDVREVYSLPKNSNIKSREAIEKILKQITLDDIKTAIFNAERIRKSKSEEDKLYVTETDYYYPDPYFSIDIFLKKVLEKSGIDIHTE
ncbi:MAG: RloB family protein [Bacteroides sp.]|nr:RloB family protein [Eubacterium sp.]MCM1419387.1 RloB family protein [Roseburia sp.]MCM1463211.1 RloB family protein [Bacteroides sp.]